MTTPVPSWPPPGLDPAALPVRNPAIQRVFVVFNASKTDTLYVGLRADTALAPELTGFRLAPQETQILKLPPTVISGRIWVRTGCVPLPDKGPIGEDLIRCDTGSCGRGTPDPNVDPGNNGEDGTPTPVRCLTESAKTCACLIEFTLISGQTDTYDVSMVDGWNASMVIMPIPGRFSLAHPGQNDPYDSKACGSTLPAGDNTDVAKWCPLELQYPSFSGRKQMGCLNLCKALDRSDMDRVDDKTPLTFSDLPPGVQNPITAKKWLGLLKTEKAWMHSTTRPDAMMRDIVCCQCGAPDGECEGNNANWGCDPSGNCAPGVLPFKASFKDCQATCKKTVDNGVQRGPMWKDPALNTCYAGCTPYNTTYPESWSYRRCPVRRKDGKPFDATPLQPGFDMNELTSVPEWPLSSTGEDYPEIFKKRSPGAYSWQFDDHKSTFVTRDADFFVIVGLDDEGGSGPTPPPHVDPPPPHVDPPPAGGSAPWPWWAWVLVAAGVLAVTGAVIVLAVMYRKHRATNLALRQGRGLKWATADTSVRSGHGYGWPYARDRDRRR